MLSEEGHSITIIDKNPQTLENSLDSLDVMGVLGNGANPKVQMEAGVQNADLLIASTSLDELNMLCCLIAKHLGTKHTIARIRNPEYTEHLNMLKSQFGLSMVINPELEAAREISRVIKFPLALKVDTFSKDRVEIVSFKLKENSPVIGKCLKDLPSKYGAKILICAVTRDGGMIIPGGGFQLEEGDIIHITGESSNTISFLNSISHGIHKIKNIMVVGGGRIFYYLAAMLDDRSLQIKVIEKDPDRCGELCELFPKVVVIGGDGADMELLESEGLDDMDAFISLTNIDEQNIIVSMLANLKKIPKVITKISRMNYMPLINEMGMDTTFDPKMGAVNQITQYVRTMSSTHGSQIKALHKLFDSRVEALEFEAAAETRYLGIPLEKLKLKKNLLVAVIVRNGKVIIPGGKDCIMLGDSVVTFTNKYQFTELNDIFDGEL